MQNKKAFITGASRGIGRGITRVLSDSGYDIAFTYNSMSEDAQSLYDQIINKGRRCYYYQASLHLPDVAEEVTGRAVNDFGGIDLMVCNAGLTRHNDLLTLEGEFIDFLYNLNYRSYLLCAKVAANYMVSANIKGNIIFITSTRGARAYAEDAIYGGLKAALQRSAESMAIDMGKYAIRVNCVAPGATAIRDNVPGHKSHWDCIASKIIPLERLGTPDEVGYLVRFIASDEAAYMTGNIIKLDGGLILSGRPEKID